MMRYLVQPRDWIFVKSYGFLSFAKNMSKNIGKYISKNLSGKYSQKLLDHAKHVLIIMHWKSKINYNSTMMEYQKIKNLLDNTPNQPTKIRTKIMFQINDDSGGMYNTNSETEFKTSMWRLDLCDYSDAYILVRGPITIVGAEADDAVRQVVESMFLL